MIASTRCVGFPTPVIKLKLLARRRITHSVCSRSALKRRSKLEESRSMLICAKFLKHLTLIFVGKEKIEEIF